MSILSEILAKKLGAVGVLINDLFNSRLKPAGVQSAVNGLSEADFELLENAVIERAAKTVLSKESKKQ